MKRDYHYLLYAATRAAIAAGKEIMRQYQDGFETFTKEDGSPVTTGDFSAHKLIDFYLQQTDIAVLSEEGEKFSHPFRQENAYWCVDPIDGTRDFINKTDEFCVSIGLVENDTATVGVLYAPALNLFYFAAEGVGAYKFDSEQLALEGLAEKPNLLDNLIAQSKSLPVYEMPKDVIFLTSRFHKDQTTENYIEKLKVNSPDLKVKTMGCAIKLGIIAERSATEYTRFMSVNFWDIAGGHAIAKYTGLAVVNPEDQEEINYQDRNMRVNGYSIKWK